ncbi:hypothetical protein F511_30046 [Dorcoceras hygrometricum]|uniref:Dystroglycan-like n=1 Tax=Dorcoceras hygrometricum TaxID=472368 RepID=A0A2Z7CY94_9LAMI|nr:hypothetical protein F511_30046 [Dorcoceras hygrometricum]
MGFLRQPALEGLTRSARTDSPRQDWLEQFPAARGGGGGAQGRRRRLLEEGRGGGYKSLGDTASRGPTTIGSTTIGKSRVAKDPIAMRTSWRSNSDIASVTSIRYPRMSASGESSTTMHRLLHASGSHPIPPPDDPNNNSSDEGPSTQSRSAYDKFNKMGFVKADMMYNCLESVKYDNQNSPKLNENGKVGIGFSKPERFKPNWLKNRLDKGKAKASQKPFVPNRSWHNSKKEALVEFFANGTVRDGLVVSSVDGVLVEISEELFAETFELLVDGLGDLSEIPKDVIFDARSIVSLSGEPISLSGRKNQMKFEFRLLCDIMAKAISVKAGSFNAITVEKFSLITAVVCRIRMNWAKFLIRMNWAKFLFSILKKMVTPGSKQAKGFAIQISLLLTTIPTLELGESSAFPASKILSKNTVHRFVSINDRDGAEEATGAAKQRAASKKRPAADVGAAVPKKKRSIKKKSVSSLSTLEMVAVAEESVPIQQVAEPSAVEEPRYPSADDVDLIIQQVLDETRAVDAPADKAQPVATEEKLWYDLPYEDLVAKWEAERPVVTASDTDEEIATMDVAPADGDQQVQESLAPISTDDMLSADEQMSLDDIILTVPVDIPLPSSSMEITNIMMGKTIKIPGETKWTWFLKNLPRIHADDKGKDILVEKDPIRGNPAREHFFLICADIDLLVQLRAKVIDEVAQFLNSFSLKKLATINFEEMYKKEEQVLYWGEFQSFFRQLLWIEQLYVVYRDLLLHVDATASSLPPASQDFSAALADLQVTLSEQMFEYQSGLSSKLHKIEQSVCDSLRDQADIFRNLSQEARQEGRTLDDVQTIRFNEFRKNILAQNASIFVGLADVRKEVEEVNAKVDIMASRLNVIQKDAEATKEALSHQLFEFQSSAQENHSVLHAQLSELVDYIHRGGANKKGESGSRGLQQPANVQIEGSAVRPTFAQRVEVAQRHIVHTVLDADANRALLEKQDAAERDRERRRREARLLKRRRRN